ncbi:MAG TPA: AsmA-like C-terminal region-containing protein [Vicinamibacterales bacterium]|nr:AsmA-like C-terminal region-containing protein [Vicinamibacterales bacterium]
MFLVVAAVLVSAATKLTPHVREAAVAALAARFDSHVTIRTLQVGLFPRPQVSGSGLALRLAGRTDVPPLMSVGSFSASAGLLGLLGSPLRLRAVELDRLEITIPPRRDRRSRTEARAAETQDRPAGDGGAPDAIRIDRIAAREARLEILSRNPEKLPRVFEIHDLVMHDFGGEAGAPFRAVLTNPLPRGRIATEGAFGPWVAGDPGRTPVRGTYTFDRADLNTIDGLGGTLTSRGRYAGVLEHIDVSGETWTPDFSLDLARQPLPLHTRFDAVVDGTNGDTRLERIEGRLGETPITARGLVVRAQEVRGRHVAVEASVRNGRIEDLVRLAVRRDRPPVVGLIDLDAKLFLPAGGRDVIERLRLDGAFALDRARFTRMNVQRRIDELSRRGRGRPDDESPSVVSKLSGVFRLRDGRLDLERLRFAVPGAVVELAGAIDLRRETLDLGGDLLLDAELAETTSGVTAVLARLAQPLFRRKGGGSKLPIRVTGTLERPEFKLDLGRALTPGR